MLFCGLRDARNALKTGMFHVEHSGSAGVDRNRLYDYENCAG